MTLAGELLSDLRIVNDEEAYARIEAEIAAAEERGRRRGVEERDELRALLREARDYVDPRIPHWQGFRGRIDAALAPRDSGKEGA